MKKIILSFCILILCSSCKGTYPEIDNMKKFITKYESSANLVALDEKSYFFTLKGDTIQMDILLDDGDKDSNNGYFSIMFSKTNDDNLSYDWVQADKFHDAILKQIKNRDCNILVDDAIGKFTNKKACTGIAKQKAEQFYNEITTLLDEQNITMEDTYTFGYRYLSTNKNVATANYRMLKDFSFLNIFGSGKQDY